MFGHHAVALAIGAKGDVACATFCSIVARRQDVAAVPRRRGCRAKAVRDRFDLMPDTVISYRKRDNLPSRR